MVKKKNSENQASDEIAELAIIFIVTLYEQCPVLISCKVNYVYFHSYPVFANKNFCAFSFDILSKKCLCILNNYI